jgi:hypothetical protein
MGNNKRAHHNRHQKRPARASREPTPLLPRVVPEKAAPIVYGKPFTLLEDKNKLTFEFSGGAWVRYAMSIAECRENNCQVQRLPQEVNSMIRYEVRAPIS